MATRKRRRNQGLEGYDEFEAHIPFEEWVDVEKLKLHQDGTFEVIVRDRELEAAQLEANPRRRRKKANPRKRAAAKKRPTKRTAKRRAVKRKPNAGRTAKIKKRYKDLERKSNILFRQYHALDTQLANMSDRSSPKALILKKRQAEIVKRKNKIREQLNSLSKHFDFDPMSIEYGDVKFV